MRIRTLVALVWTGAILVATWLPAHWLRTVEESVERPGLDLPLDKIVHVGIFAGFGFLWARAGSPDGRYSWVLVGGILLAILSELGQGIPYIGRTPSVWDIMADIVGLILGLAAYRLVGPRPHPRTAAPEHVARST